MPLHQFVRVPNLFTLDRDQLMQHCLRDTNTHLIILCLVIVVDAKQILVNSQQYPVDLQHGCLLLDDLSQFEQALDHEAGQLG